MVVVIIMELNVQEVSINLNGKIENLNFLMLRPYEAKKVQITGDFRQWQHKYELVPDEISG